MKALSKVGKFGKVGVIWCVFTGLLGVISGCEGEEFERDEMGEACPPKVMQKDGYLVCEGPVNIGFNDETGFYYPNPSYVYCDKNGKSIEDKEGNIKEGKEKVKANSNAYMAWNDYYNWIVKEGAEYRLTMEDEVDALYKQIKSEYRQEFMDYTISYVNINGMMYDPSSGKFKDTFKYGYCPLEASRCSMKEMEGERIYFCANMLTCSSSEHYDGVSRCVSDSVEKCGSETNDCTKISGWVTGECNDGQCVATECDESKGYILENGECKAACMPGQVKCDDKCVDPMTDPNYCGAVGTVASCESKGAACASGAVCAGGECVAPAR